MKTADSGTRWRIVVYEYDSDIPDGNDKEATRVIVDDVTAVRISSDKDSPDSPCSIVATGDLNDAFFIGNWIIVRSRLGAWRTDEPNEGIPRFVGQITAVRTTYVKDASGNLRRQSFITARKWSAILQTPVRYDLTAVTRVYNATSLTNTVGHAVNTIDSSAVDKIGTVAQQVFNPWSYAGVVLKFIGALNANTEGSLVDTLKDNLGVTYRGLEGFTEVATKMPTIPKELLDDVGATGAEPTNPFRGSFTSPGFMATLIGVQTSTVTDYETVIKSGISESFSGIFSQPVDDLALYEVTNDRPIITNVGTEFTQGAAAWELLKGKVDPTITEVFTDIWYYSDSKNVKARPVLVVRDKPFALKEHWQQLNSASGFSAKWTMLDDLPRVWIDDTLIKEVSLDNTFYGSPNFLLLKYYNGAIRQGFLPGVALSESRVRLAQEMSRFGGIEYYPETAFGVVDSATSPTAETSLNVNTTWYRDVAQINYLWHCLNYQFLSGAMVLVDNNVPVMVGNNITWKMGKNTLAAHVERVEWVHSLDQASGRKSTQCTIQFSHCCYVKDDGTLGLIGPRGFNDLFEKSIQDKIAMPSVGSFSGYLEQLKAFQEAKKIADNAKQAVRKLFSLRSPS